MIQGQARIDFEEWLNIQEFGELFELGFEDGFFGYPFSMQYGVLVDWFDSVGIYILKLTIFDNGYCVWESYEIRHKLLDQIQAIEKANEIYNNR